MKLNKKPCNIESMNIKKGIIAGLLAGVLWGTTFLAPVILKNFSSFDVMFGRFAFFGMISLLNFSRIKKLLQKLSIRNFYRIILLSATGFWLYTLILFIGIKQTNTIIASLIIGVLPLTITLVSRPKLNIYLAIGFFSITLGILFLLFIPLLLTTTSITSEEVKLSGIFFLLAALIIWTWFGIKNACFMSNHQEINPMDYASLIGVLSLIFILPIFAYFDGFSNLFQHVHFKKFIIWSAVLGLGASWLANIFWAYCAKNTPPSITGSLLVSETIFGLLYGFIFEQRLPYWNETLAIVFLIAGVLLVIHSQKVFE